ncbi:hypothetical protein [uncultured Deefgea sp.]|uniref:hypothetical protein n=1 Tax=uncultured Deefgea sp. TaxID=1304914 RepID=UPI002597924A|nr:hypothetical protein [uncultured Deefgea sp.]
MLALFIYAWQIVFFVSDYLLFDKQNTKKMKEESDLADAVGAACSAFFLCLSEQIMPFDEVFPTHFNTLSRNPFPHVLIEQALLQLGGGSVEGSKFAKQALTAAGWRHASVVSYGKYPEEAATAFNKVRLVLMDDPNAEQLMQRLAAA